ncbi:MAG TPA: hypothetical protein VLW65_01170 [Bryobacteraceae bacterium]|nr:hypothetical protein [Bryobacteraceae bacterium]
MAKRYVSVAILAALAAVGQAQQGQVTGPVLGYVFDGAARTVRPVLGIAGASIFGGPMALGYDVTSATVAPGGDSAVALAADGSLHLVRLSGGQATEVPLNGASVKPSRVVFSPSGTAMALIAAGRAQVFGGLPGAATLVGTMDLGSAAAASQAETQSARRPAGASSASMALSDDGAWLLAVENGSLELIGAGGSHAIANAGRGALAAFAPGGHDAALLDSQQTLTMVRSVDTTAARQVLAANVGMTGAAGLGFSAEGKSLFLAGSGQAMVFDVASGKQTPVSCNCSATGLARMGSVYRLNEPGSGPVWLLDPAAGNPRIVFVPALGSSE